MAKDWNDLYRDGVNIRAIGDGAKLWTPKSNGKANTNWSLVTCCAADIEPEPVDWLWQGRLARGKQTALAGEPGLGKSQIGIDIAAKITKGAAWPNNEGNAPCGRVIILSAEDDAADTLVPRLIAANADLTMVDIISAIQTDNGKGRRIFNLQTDLQLLEERIRQLGGVQLVEIDPTSAYFGKGVDSHKDVDVRGVLAPVSEMAGRLDLSILSIAHFNKASGPSNTRALHKFMGSIAFVAAPRVAFAIIEDPEDRSRRLFLHAKNNLAAPPSGLAFRIEPMPIGNGIWSSRIAWDTEIVHMTADEAVSAGKAKKSAPALEEAKQFLAGLVGTAGVDVKEIEAEAKAAGLSWSTVRRAKDELGLKAAKAGFDGWVWRR